MRNIAVATEGAFGAGCYVSGHVSEAAGGGERVVDEFEGGEADEGGSLVERCSEVNSAPLALRAFFPKKQLEIFPRSVRCNNPVSISRSRVVGIPQLAITKERQ
jgi:hypothetical protein